MIKLGIVDVEEVGDEFFVITPSMLNAFVRNERWGIQAYYRKLYHKEAPRTHEMQEGERLHEMLGYTNKEKFVKKFRLPGTNWVIELRGVPDKIEADGRPVEAKTVAGFWADNKKLEGARVQLLCYLFLMDKDFGYVDLISRETGETIRRFTVYRDDHELFRTIKKFVSRLKRQKQLLR